MHLERKPRNGRIVQQVRVLGLQHQAGDHDTEGERNQQADICGETDEREGDRAEEEDEQEGKADHQLREEDTEIVVQAPGKQGPDGRVVVPDNGQHTSGEEEQHKGEDNKDPAGEKRPGYKQGQPDYRRRSPADYTRYPQDRHPGKEPECLLQFRYRHCYRTLGMATISRTCRSKKLAVWAGRMTQTVSDPLAVPPTAMISFSMPTAP